MKNLSTESDELVRPAGAGRSPATACESGVIRRAVVDERPPWHVVREYLSTGAHRVWVEGYAAHSEGFAYLLERQRSAASEPDTVTPDEGTGVVIDFPR